MTKALRLFFLSGVLLLSASFMPAAFASAWAVDEFGVRFTNQAPAALGVSESPALLATQEIDGISAEDLNAIAPAAGGNPADSAVTDDDAAKQDGRPLRGGKADTSRQTPAE